MGTLAPEVRSTTSARYLKAAACAAAVVIVLLTLWFASDVFFVAVAGVLLAIILRTLSEAAARVIRAGPGVSLALTCIGILALVALAVWFIGPKLSAEVDELRRDLPPAWSGFKTWLHRSQWAGDVVDRIGSERVPLEHATGRLLSAFSTLASALGGIVVVLFVGLYFAADPGLYERGILKLLPKNAERRGREVLRCTGQQLRHWLVGKLSLMCFVGVATAVGLWLLNMPLVLSLAAIAALLDFVPNIGPIVSAVPALLIAFTRSPVIALEVAGLYFGVQIIESYVLQPLVQKRAVSLPPSLTLLAQLLLGTLFGSPGLILATPLTVIALTWEKMLYVEDILKKGPDD
jgi:predicted PurR-regulated permease PerM